MAIGPYRYFNPIQDPKMVGVNPELMAKLDQARHLAGIPFIITSGLRTQAENDALPNAVKNSAHLTGDAVDLLYKNYNERFLILMSLFNVGFQRIGMGHNFVHADISMTLPQRTFFVEDSRY